MTQYLLAIQQPDDPTDPEPQRPDDETLARIMRDVEQVRTDMRDAGVWVFSGGLAAAASATVVRTRGDEVLLTDGPYAEGKEHIGGLTILDCADLDEALHWAGRLSRAIHPLPVEVRPFQ
ncbi:YciI family protein [Actinomycetospora termitidis]|uniref:YciI family protein n=1 Tax=Actinomycetospora termitidis TaxID=3053470 RepID=A0ABT7M2Y2_9PSEU|nr:YciI family protein [Actinomycetospora sp. Odt1-22]MDL5154392.1 YciI family protein [Actinomycetospora sp. Odt1-22]